ncbi:pseudaminic acid cytidylyltransferase [Campylobacter sp. RM16192]|uniref:pseudaminic acid cytidylyltransferase n=1 Tax=Campylobacter sp. RM16192 TaxID=1660080 RepID=UPI0014525692|nr:pseudaminic acid cytidylyltransferase [Campylobacter sp. RM16192]QCD51831.1 CMP-pseudaminic acid synthetase [Campylobacter sp. RM16192]
MNLCVIPARGGSKRIPHKNIKDFLGNPIISYSIKAALSSKVFDEVIVSTDSEEIAEVARKFGAKTPFLRDANLSDDFTSTGDVIKDACIKMGDKFKTVCCLYPTAPLLKGEVLNEAYNKFKASECEYLFSVCEFSFPIQRAIKIDLNGKASMFYPEYNSTRSQDLEPAYHDAGQFYFGKRDAWLQGKWVFKPHSKVFILKRNLVCDIDTIEDFEFAKKLYKINHGL